MARDKKKKKKDKKAGKVALSAKRLQSFAENPMVANIVASALVATAAAIKDPAKARKLAAQTGDQLTDLAKDGVDRGNAMWQLALDVGRRALEEFGVTGSPKVARKAAAKPARTTASKPARKTAAKPVRKTAAKPARKTAAKPARAAARPVRTAAKPARKTAAKAARKTAAKATPKVAKKPTVRRRTRPRT